MSSSFCAKFLNLASVNCKIGDPSRCRGSVAKRLLAFDGAKSPGSSLVISVGEVRNPAVDLMHTFGRSACHSVLRTELQQRLKVTPNGRHAAGLEHQHIVAAKVIGQLEGAAARVKTVTRETQTQLREIPAELRK